MILSAAVAVAGELPSEVRCEGVYPFHPQGVATDGTSVYWSFTTVLVKTDWRGKALATYETKGGHMGDLCCHGGSVYVGINNFSSRGIRVGDEVWRFDGASLTLEKKFPTPQTVFCNNGLEWYGGCFFVIGSAPKLSPVNLVHVYTPDFRFLGSRMIASGWTNLGVQTVCRAGDRMLFGYYGSSDGADPHPSGTFVVNAADLLFGRESNESAPVVACLKRIPSGTDCGMLVHDGRVWECHGISLVKIERGRPQRWTARLVPSKALDLL